MVWLDQGLSEDRDTDGHVDLICRFHRLRRSVAAVRPARRPQSRAHGEQPGASLAAGLDVIDFTPLARRPKSRARWSPTPT